jgi:uncharacterized protein YutE (UPF0331/DUF86 family)
MRDIADGWSRRLVEADLLRRKTEQVLHHCDRLARRAALTAAQLAADEDLCNAVLMDLQQAIQACIDLAAHACVDDRLGAPATSADAFALLARHGVIDETLARRLTGAAGLRNLIVHQYTTIDLERMVQVIGNDLDDLRRFVAALRSS